MRQAKLTHYLAMRRRQLSPYAMLSGVMLKLSRAYPSQRGAPVIGLVDPRIFSLSYIRDCKAAGCADFCCSEGVDLDTAHAELIMRHAGPLSQMVSASPEEWFEPLPTPDPDYPSGSYTATRSFGGRCVFLMSAGCAIHAYCIAEGIDYRELKPMVSVLFPITFDRGLLMPAPELADAAWVCAGAGTTLYSGIRPDLLYYFGPDFVAELNALAKAHK